MKGKRLKSWIALLKQNYKVVLSVQVIFCALFLLMGSLLYNIFGEQIYKNQIRDNYELTTTCWHGEYDNVDECLYAVLQQIGRVDIKNSEYAKNCAIHIQVYDKEKELLKDYSNAMAILVISKEGDETEIHEVVDLYEYFDKEDIEGLKKFYSGKYDNIWISKLLGDYNENGVFEPAYIRFECGESLKSYTLQNKKSTKITGWLEGDGNLTAVDCVLFSPSEKCLNNLKKIDTADEYATLYDSHRIKEVGNVMIDYTAFYDVEGILWDTSEFTNALIFIAIILELCVLVIVGTYIYFQKQQRELAQSRDTFINAMAHELKTPVAVMQNTAEYIELGLRPEKQSHYLEVLMRESDHMNHLLNQMLLYTRVSGSSYRLNRERVKMKELFSEVLLEYEDHLQAGNRQIVWKIENEKEILCDRTLMRMVIDNFISNAIKYGTEGTDIVITIQKQKILVYNETSSLTEEELENVWQPMYQTDQSRTSKNSSGMGLAISASILRLHHAWYQATNQENGVEFSFSFEPPKSKSKPAKRRIYFIGMLFGIAFIIIEIIYVIHLWYSDSYMRIVPVTYSVMLLIYWIWYTIVTAIKWRKCR